MIWKSQKFWRKSYEVMFLPGEKIKHGKDTELNIQILFKLFLTIDLSLM